MIYNICPTPIYAVTMNDFPKKEMIAALDEQMPKDKNANFGDDYNIEQVHNLAAFKQLNDVISTHTKQYITYLDRGAYNYNLYAQKSWGVRITRGGRVKPHIHGNGHLSCVFYLSLPEGTCSTIQFFNEEAHFRKHIPLINSETEEDLWNELVTNVDVTEGTLIIFPSWLSHGVFAESETDEPRYSVSYDMTMTVNEPKEGCVLDITHWKKL